MFKNTVFVAAVAGLVLAMAAASANAALITIDNVQAFKNAPQNESSAFTVTASYNASASDKLVVTVSTENGWGQAENISAVTYNGISMTRAVQGLAPEGAAAVAIFYLDDPGVAGPIVITSAKPNSGLTVVYALSGTAPGVGNVNSSQTGSVGLTTTAADSLVIAHHLNGSTGDTGSAATADAPLTQTASYLSTNAEGNGWTGGGAGYQQVPVAGSTTSSFSNIGTGGYATVAAEFTAVPEPATLTLLALGGLGLILGRKRR